MDVSAEKIASKGIRGLYERIPRRYEWANRLMTLGLDRWWRRQALRLAVRSGGTRWLDVCTGTGEMAIGLKRRAPEGTAVEAADFSAPMLAVARAKPAAAGITFTEANADALPFDDALFDLVTISFAARNLDNEPGLDACFREAARVLKPGGRLVNIETSQPPLGLVRWLLHLYTRLWVAPAGRLVTGEKAPYAYLAASIRSFQAAPELAALLRHAGFDEVRYHRLAAGIIAVHVASKKG